MLVVVILFVATFLPLIASPTLASVPSGITLSHRAPPGHVLSPDLADVNASQNPEPDLGQPNYNDWAFYQLSGLGGSVSYTHLRAHETRHDLVCRLLLEKKK